jgi:hypothetical protein
MDLQIRVQGEGAARLRHLRRQPGPLDLQSLESRPVFGVSAEQQAPLPQLCEPEQPTSQVKAAQAMVPRREVALVQLAETVLP